MQAQWKRVWSYVSVLALLTPVCAKEDPVELLTPDQKVVGLLNMVGQIRTGTATVTGTRAKLGGFTSIFDRQLNTVYEPEEAGAAEVSIAFAQPQTLTLVRVLAVEGEYEWKLEAAGSQPDLVRRAGTYQVLVPARRGAGGGSSQVRLAAPALVRVLRFTLSPISGGDRVKIREINLEAEQDLESLYVKARALELPLGERVPLEVFGYFSGSELKPLRSRRFVWQVTPAAAAKVENGRIVGRRVGPVEVRVIWGKLTSSPLRLHFTEGV